MIKRLQLFFLAILITGCGTVSTVRPLEPGQNAVAVSVGGPIVTLPGIGDLPLPYSVLRYRWGVLKSLEAHIGLHPTMLAFGTIGLEAGLSYEIIHGKKLLPSLVLGANPTFWVNPFNVAAGFSPEVEAIFSWIVCDKLLLYSGGQTFFQLEKPYAAWAGLLGAEYRLGYAGVDLEVKWYSPTENSEYRVVNFPISPLDQGALGVVLGVTLYPGGSND